MLLLRGGYFELTVMGINKYTPKVKHIILHHVIELDFWLYPYNTLFMIISVHICKYCAYLCNGGVRHSTQQIPDKNLILMLLQYQDIDLMKTVWPQAYKQSCRIFPWWGSSDQLDVIIAMQHTCNHNGMCKITV